MPNDLFKNRFRIPSARAQWHHYNGGMYFVTICTAGREHFFGEITNSEMRLSAIGEYTRQCIENTSQHTKYAQVPLYVIMPNHLHLIVIIDDAQLVETCHGASLHANHGESLQWRVSSEGKNQKMQDVANHQGRLSAVIGLFKQSVTRHANANNIPFAWQTRFHDHIIRHTDEINHFAEYIQNNVAKWDTDEFNV